jgi:site-specific recombinase XerC
MGNRTFRRHRLHFWPEGVLEGLQGFFLQINIELSILRGFWKWMLEMEADGVMLNPATGVRVRVAKNQAKVASRDAMESLPSTIL